MEAAVFLLAVFAEAAVAAWIASRRGRSSGGWFLIVLFTHLIGLLILLALPRLTFSCPSCATPYRRGVRSCASCSAALPEADVAELLTPGLVYELKCRQCAWPYRLEDYSPEAQHIFCSSCHAELPRDDTSSVQPTV
jgi:hypothetical protein